MHIATDAYVEPHPCTHSLYTLSFFPSRQVLGFPHLGLNLKLRQASTESVKGLRKGLRLQALKLWVDGFIRVYGYAG